MDVILSFGELEGDPRYVVDGQVRREDLERAVQDLVNHGMTQVTLKLLWLPKDEEEEGDGFGGIG